MHHPILAAPLLRRFISRSAYCLGLSILGILVVGTNIPAAGAPAISQNFQASGDNLTAGTLVSLTAGSPNTVEPSTSTRVADIVGVVADSPLIELGEEMGSAQVVTSGVTHALVSNINGDIESGDKITASPITGVGMKVSEPTLIMGTAQASLESVEASTRTITDRDGNEQSVKVGLVPLDVSVTFYAATATQQELVPPFVQDIAETIAGKPVSPVKVIASILVLLLALISVMVLLYSSVRSSIISIGRNPLSEKAVHKSLIEVGIVVIGILLLTSITIYLILVT